MELLNLLEQFNQCHGPAGDEGGIAEVIKTLSAPYADEVYTDTMGNLIAHKKGSGHRGMFAAHMDSIGVIVTHIEEKGFLRFGNLGGIAPHHLLHTTLRFKNGIRGVVGAEGEGKTLSDLYIDIGAKDEDEAKTMVQVGDTAIYCAPVYQAGSRLVGPYMDNRIACAIQLLAMERMKDAANDLYFVFTTQEELGLRGSKTAAFAIDPQWGIAIDVTSSDDTPGAKHMGNSVFGKGAAIKIMDRSVICHPKMVEWLTTLATDGNIASQKDLIRAGGTDAGQIQQTRSGVPTGGISIPCRYVHSEGEMVETADVEACIQLVVAVAETVAPFQQTGV